MSNLETILNLCSAKLNIALNVGDDEAKLQINDVISILAKLLESMPLNSNSSIFSFVDNTVVKERSENQLSNVLVRYLPSKFITGGLGVMSSTERGIEFFTTYTPDIFTLPITRLLTWPNGFYFNHKTKDNQLLVRSDLCIICFDGLPSSKLNIKVVFLPLTEDSKFINFENLTTKQLSDVTCDLENTLKYHLT